MSQNKKGKYTGAENHFYGKHHTEESRRKMSESRKGRVIDDEWRQHLSEASTVKRQVQNLDTGEIFDSVKKAAESCGVASTNITRACKGKTKTSGGYRWKYVS